MKQLTITLFIFFAFNISYAQSEYHPGFYLTYTNDTIFGLINNKGDGSNIKMCSYKKDATSTVVDFSPSQIKAYRFTNSKYYVSKEIPNGFVLQMTFLECLIEGKVSVYYYKTNEIERYYIEKDDKLAAMDNDERIVTDPSGSTFTKNSNQYLSVLGLYFADKPEIEALVKNTSFNKKSLINISKKYNESANPGISSVIYNNSISSFVFYVGFYLTDNTLNLKCSDPDFDYVAKPSLSAGLVLQANTPKINKNLFLQFAIGYGKSSFARISDLNKEYTLKYSTLHTSFAILFKVPVKMITPVFSLGGYYNFINSPQFEYRYYNEPNSQNIYDSMSDRAGYGINAGIGLEIPIKSHFIYHLSINYEKGKLNLNPVAELFNYGQKINDAASKNISITTGFLF